MNLAVFKCDMLALALLRIEILLPSFLPPFLPPFLPSALRQNYPKILTKTSIPGHFSIMKKL